MPKPAPPTLTDYAVTAISPVLIMAMVGSLVFFLIEVLYDGNYSDRLLWTMFFFVVGTVLIARIMILHGANRALIYAAGLAAATFLALQAFVDYPNLGMRSFAVFINAGLMALIWWSANKLTWDCTHIDEDRRNAGRGVLDAAGLDAESEDAEEAPAKKPKKNSTWFEKYLHHRKLQNAKPHTPGVWVLYFSLAALPLFGLGQSLIPSTDVERRRAAFTQIVVYVGSGLGLLATTTLLGLRKYLRDRGASIPPKMTAGWLGLAAGIVIVLLFLAAFLPRPNSETPLVNVPKWSSSKDREASKNAKSGDKSTGKGEGQPGGDPSDDKNAQGNGDGKSDEKKDGEGEKSGGESESKNGGEKKDGKQKGSSGRREKGDSKSEKGEQKGEEQSKNESSSPPPQANNILEKAGSLLKWLAWIIIALLVIGAIVIFFLRYLAPFTSWAKNLLDWLSSLFRRKEKSSKSSEEADAKPEAPRPPPFSSFADPDGGSMSVEEMVQYSFAAFESWAWERKLGRNGQETPIEFARRVEKENGFDAGRLASLYSQIAYSGSDTPRSAAKTVREFWSQIPHNAGK